MKILLISNMRPSKQKPYSGVFVLNQYNYLKKKEGIKVELFAMERTFNSRIGSVIKYLKAFIRFIPFYFKKFDVIHLHFFFPLIIIAVIYKFLRKDVKLIVTFHGSDITRNIKNELSKSIFRVIIKEVDIVISVGEDLAQDVKSKLNRNSDYILSAGVDDQVFYPTNDMKTYHFLFVGSFIERKGVDLFLNAIETLNDLKLKFCFVGSGPLKKDIENLSKKFNITIYENQSQHALRTLYNQSKFFVLPSRDEPFGLVATESLFCGTPAIVTNVGGLKLQINDGVNGFICLTNNTKSLVEILQKSDNLIENEYNAMVKNASSSNKEFSLSNITEQLIKIYKS